MKIVRPSSVGLAKEAVDLSTALITNRDKFLFWQDVISTYLSPSDSFQTAPEKTFEGHLKCIKMGQVSIAHHRCDPLLNIRNPQCIRRMPDDDYFVAVATRANAQLRQGQRTAVISDGDVVIYSSATPFEWDVRGDSDFVVARIARRQFVSRVPEIDAMTARIISSRKPSGSIIGHAVRDLVNMNDDLNEGMRLRLGGSLIEIVTSLVAAAFTPFDRNLLDEDLINKIKKFLLDNIDNPDFELQTLAQQLGLSARTIFRIFAAEGTTPMRWFWKQRLALAFRLISDGQVKNVSQAAMQTGFNDFAHFSRSFRSEFKVTPSSVLRKELAESS
ncbi:helix-turn-helix domain-containing protein [Mesorhizobium sp. M8A.F.Ca.ET.173.01.1.1]|nr:helix-turn-helix domain-containing protein [Mesorhizobium sp. M8A.F.Ca.ET.173.01.1.1]